MIYITYELSNFLFLICIREQANTRFQMLINQFHLWINIIYNNLKSWNFSLPSIYFLIMNEKLATLVKDILYIFHKERLFYEPMELRKLFDGFIYLQKCEFFWQKITNLVVFLNRLLSDSNLVLRNVAILLKD